MASARIILAVLLAFSVPALHAQAVSIASITGRVIDAQDAVVPNAQVKITAVDTGAVRTVTTNDSGIYTLPGLPVGPYKLEVSAQSFQTYVQSGIVLRVNDNVQINVSMSVGQMTETIQVEANASMVQTQTNTISQVIDQRRIVELPLNGRDPTQLILVSGASVNHVDGTNTGSKSFFSSQSISIAGGLGNATNYLLDGGDNNDSFTNVNLPFPFPDALQEFSVETSALPARNGLHPGGLVNAVTKSGSNQWHGSAFEFIRNGAVNAINYFAPRQDSLKRNQFGGTFGGHIVRDKLFFFGGFQGSRIRQDPSTLTAFVPTPAALAGDFSVLESKACQITGVERKIFDPTTGAELTSRFINPSRFDAAAVKLTSYLPKTTDPCGKVNYGIPVQSNEQQYVTRVDWNINGKHTVYGRYFYDDFQLAAFFSPTNALVTTVPGNSERAQSIVFGDTYSISPTIVNSFHFTFSRRRDNRGPNATGVTAAQLGVQNIYQGTDNFLQLSVSNGFNVGSGTGALGSFNINSYQEADDVDVSKGKHQMAFGVDIIRTHDNQNNHFEDNGNFQFNGNYSKDPLLDFLAGKMNKFEQSLPQQNAIRQTVVGLYAQDTWHATPKLVVNAGLRWEPTLFPQDYFGRGSTFSRANFDAGIKSQVFPGAPAGQLFFGDPGVPKAFTGDTLTNFSPRLGLVYNPDGEGKTTFRVGGAILYDSVGTFTTYRVIANNLPYGATIAQTGPIQLSNPYATYQGGSNPFPLPFTPSKNFAFPLSAPQVILPDRIKPTYLSTWNASVQHQFSKDWVFSLSYLGNKASHLWIGNETNPAVYVPGTYNTSSRCGPLANILPTTTRPGTACSTITNTASRRLLTIANPAVGAYYNTQVIAQDGGNSNYHGMLTSLEHRFANNYTILANYTWSKCSAEQPVQSLGTEGVVANPYSLKSDYGPCTYDATNIFNLTGVFTSNVHGMGMFGHLLNNWQIAPLVRYQTGLPVNPLSGFDNSLTGIGLDRPDVTGLSRYKTGATRNSKLYQYFDAAGFTQNAIGTFGTASHFSLRAPSYVDVDTSVSRRFGIYERLQLETRVEAFNVLNHPNFMAPNANLFGSNFGRITTAMDPRILQAAVKLTF